ncbi:hypothetical protein KBJ98_12335 [Flavobacterium sp. F-328]|uniref:Lipoprotein n=1 Tax=Flavobacterium erciyesense TaxID=2825842 RepID=A0ABS5D657_9FLAO|nr:hypothetical protein [Flavobacterium erciyesense]MBQ0909493.1 hypothetical protein [Flavobacterium erciyesense]
MKPILNLFFALAFSPLFFSCQDEKAAKKPATTPITKKIQSQKPQLDTVDYNMRMLALSNQDTTGRWPAESPYPLVGAVLPYQRIIAFYGNLYSKRMGILGEYPKDEMLQKLQSEVAKWQAADSTVQAIPALHYIAVSAQSKPGKANRYNMRMPFKQIDTLLAWAKPIKALVFLDVQIGHSTVKEEVTQLESYLAKPNVHLGIDPEFSMKGGHVPGKKIGTLDASDINDAIEILARLVREKKLPPKVLVVHRFTQGMVTNYQNIKKVPEVQIVMHMDGFGSQILKKSTYLRYIYREPVQFTGFKLFYKNDNWNNWSMYTPEQLVQLTPKPIYIQYQ